MLLYPTQKNDLSQSCLRLASAETIPAPSVGVGRSNKVCNVEEVR